MLVIKTVLDTVVTATQFVTMLSTVAETEEKNIDNQTYLKVNSAVSQCLRPNIVTVGKIISHL